VLPISLPFLIFIAMTMPTHNISVQHAIKTGLKLVGFVGRVILLSFVGLCILLLFVAFSWWWFLLIPLGMIASSIYTSWAIPRWRIWAYNGVADIHQLQRSAEICGLLPLRSPEKITGIIDIRQRGILEELVQRFNEEYDFIDDPSMPKETHIYPASMTGAKGDPLMTINSVGIWTQNDGFFGWGQITNERIAHVSSSSRMPGVAGIGATSSRKILRFEFSDGSFEMPLAMLHIDNWELDLLMYIYRGRFVRAGRQEITDKLLPEG
jgi:hypothetical protein